MYLKSLEINGFKSFAKKSTLEFTTPISSIVGPNGSGKSNVAEAFRFVLGEQSIKSLRGKKGEDLIFNGSAEVGRSNRASVKVTFDNRNRFLQIDFDEVTIERVVHRDSVNEYFINGSAVRLKDILELLAQAHIGSSGHHIISQGEADKILNANPRERRAMIEDALGLKIYQYKRQESERKLEKTEENIASVESLRKEVAPHLKFLKKQVEKVEKTLQMKGELRALYLEYFKREDDYITFSKAAQSAEKKPLEHELSELEHKLSQAKKILEESTQKDKKSVELIALEESVRTVRTHKDELMRDLGRIEGEVSAEERALKKQHELAHTDDGKMVSFKEVMRVADEIKKEAGGAEDLQDLSALKKLVRTVTELITGFVAAHRTQVNDIITKESEVHLETLRHEKQDIEVQVSELKKKEDTLQLEYNELKLAIEREKDTNRQAERDMFTIMTRQQEVISKLTTVRAAQDRLNAEEEDFKRELHEAAALIGRAVLDFASYVVVPYTNIDGSVGTEPRALQEDRRRSIEKIKIRIEDAGGGGGEDIMKEFREVSERDAFLERELADLHKSSDTLKHMIVELNEKLTTEFKHGVEKINAQFEHFFALMFGGGQASLKVIREKKKKRSDTDLASLMNPDTDLELAEAADSSEEEGEEGLDIEVSLPRKKIKGLVMLSGGERALTSIALLFAVSQVNPPPFIILDETDAALDEANSKKYGDMIENLSKYSQLILITHNRETMSRAGVLYGVTMGSGGVSKLLSIEFEEAVTVAK